MLVYVVRHGEAHDVGEKGVTADADRPLTPRGHKRSRRLGQALAALGVRSLPLLTSPLRRARETADELAAAMGGMQVEIEDLLAPLSEAADLFAALVAHNRDCLLVGHQPLLGEFVAWTTAGVEEADLWLGKSSAACLDVTGPAAGQARLRWLLNDEVAKALL